MINLLDILIIQLLKVKLKEFRGKNIGKKLVLKLQTLYPKVEINWGMMTGDGARLQKSLKRFLYVDTKKKDKIKKLEKEIENTKKEREKLTIEINKLVKNPEENREKIKTG